MTTKTFRARVRQSIADANLQLALDNNAARRREGRLAALPPFLITRNAVLVPMLSRPT